MISIKSLLSLLLLVTVGLFAKEKDRERRIRPYGLRRVYEKGLGDRYYTGVPAYEYQHMEPEWKRDIWYAVADWRHEESPEWLTYYDYPYVVYPNFYRWFGSPYYTRDVLLKGKGAKRKRNDEHPVLAAEDSGTF